MADVGTHHFVKSSAKSSRVLVPQPSQDPHDPLVGFKFKGFYQKEMGSNIALIELEPVLEDERDGHYHGNILQSGLRTSGVGTYVSSTNGIIRFRSCRCCAIYRNLHFGARI